MRSRRSKFFTRVSLIVGLLVVVATGIPLRAQTDVRYGVAVSKDVMVAMRDGVRLAADIYRPTQNGQLVDGKFPVFLKRTPYNKDNTALDRELLCDARLCRRDAGCARPLPVRRPLAAPSRRPERWIRHRQWIGEQPWSNGSIGTMGSSYDGATQHALAIANAPYIKAMVPRNAMSDYRPLRRASQRRLRAPLFQLDLQPRKRPGLPTPSPRPRAPRSIRPPPSPADMGAHVRQYVKGLPLRPGTTPLQFAPDYEAWLVEAMSHGDNDAFGRTRAAA